VLLCQNQKIFCQINKYWLFTCQTLPSHQILASPPPPEKTGRRIPVRKRQDLPSEILFFCFHLIIWASWRRFYAPKTRFEGVQSSQLTGFRLVGLYSSGQVGERCVCLCVCGGVCGVLRGGRSSVLGLKTS
jgi:hypothetical protein